MHNSASFLDELFDCLRHLDPFPVEIVFLDDASTDDSLPRLQRFAVETRNRVPVRVLENERNAGIAGTYNHLAREARGEFLQILDADDLLVDRDFYARVQSSLQDDVDIVITGLRSNARLLDACSRTLGGTLPQRPPSWLPLLGSFATRAGVIYRRARLLEVPFPDPAWPGSDVIHLLRLRRTGGCVFLAQPRVFYRVHCDARSSQERDYSAYLYALKQLDRTTRTLHRLDLALRGIGQRWMR